jgi:hypothetical protein
MLMAFCQLFFLSLKEAINGPTQSHDANTGHGNIELTDQNSHGHKSG